MKATAKYQSFNPIHCVVKMSSKRCFAHIVNYIVIVLISLQLNGSAWGQDVWLQNHFSPNSGCNLSTSQTVNVLVNNNSGVVMPANTISMNYSIDGGAAVSENLPSNLFPGASWNFNFTVPANLSVCGAHTITVWTVRAGDMNPLNDTLSWNVQNDCTIVPGAVDASATICEGANSGILNLTGWSNGTIIGWESSIDGGTSWNPIGNVTTSESYNNLLLPTHYRVQFEGGLCPDATSAPAILSVQSQPVAGILSSNMILCVDNANGNLSIAGSAGVVNFWEFTDNAGSSWNLIPNPTTAHSFSGLTTETWYRAQIEGGVCADVLTNAVVIQIDNLSLGGTMNADQAICEGNSVNLNLTGSNGTIIQWESSLNLVGWTPIANSTLNYTTPLLSATTYYRAIAQNGVCGADTSSVVTIDVSEIPVVGVLSGSTDLCENAVSGSMLLSGYSGTITSWEFSYDAGANWTTITNTLDNYSFLNLPDTTWFRVFFDGGICGIAYSDTAFINIVPNSVAGTLAEDTSMCIGSSFELELSGSFGTANVWEQSTDLITWIPIDTDTSNYTTTPLQTTYFRVGVSNGICSVAYTDTVVVTVFPLPIVDAGPNVTITEGDTIQLNGVGGLIGIWTPPTGLFDQNLDTTDCFPLVTTTYTYSVIDANSCTNFDDVIVTVVPIYVPALDIMNVVTMNNDGFNDTWILTGIEDFPNTEVKVFNIYGKEVYSNANYQNDWDGSVNNKPLSNGTYYYVVTLVGEEPITGNLTLLGNE